jgi:hypothetical protein
MLCAVYVYAFSDFVKSSKTESGECTRLIFRVAAAEQRARKFRARIRKLERTIARLEMDSACNSQRAVCPAVVVVTLGDFEVSVSPPEGYEGGYEEAAASEGCAECVENPCVGGCEESKGEDEYDEELVEEYEEADENEEDDDEDDDDDDGDGDDDDDDEEEGTDEGRDAVF